MSLETCLVEMLVLELWWQYTAGIAVAAAVTITVISLVYVSRHRSDPDPTATSTDTEEQVSILRESWNCPPAPEVRPGNIKRVQEGHDQNVHSTLTVCVIDSGVVIGGNDAPFQQQSTEQEVREPIKTKNSFDSFIRDYVIPTFCLQRRDKQFAVLFLSKYDEYNIHKTQFGEST